MSKADISSSFWTSSIIYAHDVFCIDILRQYIHCILRLNTGIKISRIERYNTMASLVPKRSPPSHSTRLGAKCSGVTE